MVAQIDRLYWRTRPWKTWSRLVAYALFEGRPATTRGRFINPVLRAFHRLAASLPGLKKVSAPVFIIGTGRSGTTVLGKILSMHRDIGFLNEPKLLWHAGHPDEDLIGSYTDQPARFRLEATEVTPQRQKVMRRLYGAYLRLSGARRLVDKYPELIFRVPFVRALFPDALFIFISRNGLQTCASVARWSERHGAKIGGEVHDWWGVNDRKWRLMVEELVAEHRDLAPFQADLMQTTDQELRAGVEWVLASREGMALVKSAQEDRVLHIGFEALCNHPKQELGRIAAFAGLDDDQTWLQYAQAELATPSKHAETSLPSWFVPILQRTQSQIDGLGQRAVG